MSLVWFSQTILKSLKSLFSVLLLCLWWFLIVVLFQVVSFFFGVGGCLFRHSCLDYCVNYSYR